MREGGKRKKEIANHAERANHRGETLFFTLSVLSPANSLLICLPSLSSVPLRFRPPICRVKDTSSNNDHITALFKDYGPRAVVLLALSTLYFLAFLSWRRQLDTGSDCDKIVASLPIERLLGNETHDKLAMLARNSHTLGSILWREVIVCRGHLREEKQGALERRV